MYYGNYPTMDEKIYWLYDNAISTKSAVYDERLQASTAAEAIEEARRSWDSLTEREQRNRDEFMVLLAPENEDGCIDLEQSELVHDFKAE